MRQLSDRVSGFKKCIGQIEATTSPRAYPGHLTPLPSRGGGNLIIRVFQGVGTLIPVCQGWGIGTAPSISCEISGVVSYHGGRGVRGFSWKRLCLCGQLVTRKGLALKQALYRIWRYLFLNILIFLDSGYEYMSVLSCVYNEIQYLLPAIQHNNRKLNIGQLLWRAASEQVGCFFLWIALYVAWHTKKIWAFSHLVAAIFAALYENFVRSKYAISVSQFLLYWMQIICCIYKDFDGQLKAFLPSFGHLCACEMSSGWGHLITWTDPGVGHLNGILARVGGEFEQ